MKDPMRRLRQGAVQTAILAATVLLASLGSLPCRAQAPANKPAQSQTQSTASQSSNDSTPKTKRLILKDGSDEVVREYQVQGDRVRYYSIERSEWEEVPAAMVDWEAMKKAEAAEEDKNQALVATVEKQEKERQANMPADIDSSLEVAPNVFLPPGEGMFVLDGKAIFPLTQAEASEKADVTHLLGQVVIPIIPSRHNIVLDFKQAKFRLQNNQPEFYVRTTDQEQPRLHLLKAKIHGNTRIVESLDTAFKNTTTKSEEIPTQIWELAKGVYRLTLAEGLAAGEYAFLEETPGKEVNLLVWDFGVDKIEPQKSTK